MTRNEYHLFRALVFSASSASLGVGSVVPVYLEHVAPGDRAELKPRASGFVQGGASHSPWRSVAVDGRTHILWVSSNCFCSCGFLLNYCIIRSHMTKPRPKTETRLSSSSMMARGDSQRVQLVLQMQNGSTGRLTWVCGTLGGRGGPGVMPSQSTAWDVVGWAWGSLSVTNPWTFCVCKR